VQALAEDCVADLVAVVMTPTTSTTTTTMATTTTLGPGCDSEPAVFSGITAQHNATRASAIPPPSPPLDPLCWSNSLSALAQAYADTCSIEPPSNFPPGVDVGVNRDYLGGLDVDSAVHQAEPDWASEAATYDYAAMSCTLANIDTCGNYTQIVWRSTQFLGCGVKACGATTMVACYYQPPGNFVAVDGSHILPPY
jgi:hypothetical protein